MNSEKIGKLIFTLRKEKNLTQSQLASLINVSDKAISKWERGNGCPDITLLKQLSEALNINIEKILEGEITKNNKNSGNLNKINFYFCPYCNNLITSSIENEISCCGRPLDSLKVQNIDNEHNIEIIDNEDEFYIKINHEMSKTHYINFIAYIKTDSIYVKKLYPEQDSAFYMPKMYGGKFYIFCNKHGLFNERNKNN